MQQNSRQSTSRPFKKTAFVLPTRNLVAPNIRGAVLASGLAGTAFTHPQGFGSFPLVPEAYQDVPYAPIDPFKPSILYSIRNLRTESDDDFLPVAIHAPSLPPERTPDVTIPMNASDTHLELPPLKSAMRRYPSVVLPVADAEQLKSQISVVSRRVNEERLSRISIEHHSRPTSRRERSQSPSLQRIKSWETFPEPAAAGPSERRDGGRRYSRRLNLSPSPSGRRSLPRGGRRTRTSKSTSRSRSRSRKRSPAPEVTPFSPTFSDQTAIPGFQHARRCSSSTTGTRSSGFDSNGSVSPDYNMIGISGQLPTGTATTTGGMNFIHDPYFHPDYLPPMLYQHHTASSQSPSLRPIKVVPPSPLTDSQGRPTTDPEKSQAEQSELSSVDAKTYIYAFVVDTLPRQVYLNLLLHLPSLYFSRVTRIFEETELSMPKIREGVLEAARHLPDPETGIPPQWRHDLPIADLQYINLQKAWQLFIDSLMREWKTLNIISVLLLSAILTVLQIDSAAADPLTRYAALVSMIFALMSLLYGCIYIIRFTTMRKTYKAALWAEEAQRSKTSIWWNVWILLAMPATWLAWSMIAFIICIMSFVWRTGTIDDANRGPMTTSQALAPRITITIILCLGVVYFVLITNTLKRYGDMMDRAWKKKLMGWIHKSSKHSLRSTTSRYAGASFYATASSLGSKFGIASSNQTPANSQNNLAPPSPDFGFEQNAPFIPKADSSESLRGRSIARKSLSPSEVRATASTEDKTKELEPVRMVKLLHFIPAEPLPTTEMPDEDDLTTCRLSKEQWEKFSSEVQTDWDVDKLDRILPVLQQWNEAIFHKAGGQLALCEEFSASSFNYAILHFSAKDLLPRDITRYGSIPEGLQRLDILLSPAVNIDDSKPEIVSLLSRRTDGIDLHLPGIIEEEAEDSAEDASSTRLHLRSYFAARDSEGAVPPCRTRFGGVDMDHST
ncbi:hypothetical protein BDZ97DRAFT_1815490 [Flammula alnicola]|nr:hypothetical protein BDZ97DRAFT_1815490 [Flammula alnicola]